MAKQDMNELWKLFALGGAKSEGYRERKPGSARIFAYGTIGGQQGVSITTWDRAPLTVQPATPEAVQAALNELGVTETRWTL